MKLLIPVFSPPTGTWGGLTRVIAIADAARRAGHSAAFCAAGYTADTLCRKGYRVYDIPEGTMLGLPKPLSDRLVKRSAHASPPVPPGRSVGSIWLVLAGMGYARSGYLRTLVKAHLDAVDDFQPDALFTDLDPGAFLMARITGLPIAANFQSIATSGTGSAAWNWMRRASGKVLRAYGKEAITPDELFFGERVLKIVPSIPQLDDADPDRPDVCYVGSLLGDFVPARAADFSPEPGQRYVFTYVGTGSVTLDTLQEVLPRVFPAGGARTCVVGAQGIAQPEWIENVLFVPFVSADAVLPFCDWTICHGGQNTIMHSLRHGVPLLIFPGAIFERRYNAEKIVGAGAGYMGEKPDFNVAWIQERMAMQETCAAAARQLGDAINGCGGADAAIAAIETHLTK
jgi:UDP:flavonoid glycosyltransferase YjiC (YdhE family)